MRRPALAALLAPLLVLAGCLGAGSEDLDPQAAPDGLRVTFGGEVTPERLPAPDYDFATAIDADHGGIPNGHAVAALHDGSHGLELVGYNPLTRPIDGHSPAAQDSGYIAMDTWQNYVCIAHFIGTGGSTIVDIADPANPKVVSSVLSGMLNSDCQFTDDGNHLVVAAYTGVHPGLPLPPPAGDALAQGVLIFDVTDKADPQFVLHDSQGAGGGGYHNVFTATIDGRVYIFQTYTGNILEFDPSSGTLTPVSQVQPADHDIWVGQHPVTGQWIMITGAGRGTIIYDMTDPAHPMELGAWSDHDDFTGWHRQWPLTQTVEGHALMLVAGETGGGGTLPYTVLDFTDPSNIVELGHWQMPGEPVSPPPNFFTMGPHEFETWDGYAALGNYHAGVWLIDIGTLERAQNPVTIGYYLPHEVPQAHGGTHNRPFAFNPDTWGAYFDPRGYVVTADWGTGLYVLEFGATAG